MNQNRNLNKRYTAPTTRTVKSYRKFLRAKMFPKGLTKYFN